MYPEYAEIKGKKYKLNTSYKVALRCFEVIDDSDIGETERATAIIYLLFGFIPKKDSNLFLEKAKKFLECGEKVKEQEEQKRDMDFKQDWKYIIASFMSDYKVDLSKTDLHFWQFCALITGLTDNSILNRVRDIRNYDLSTIEDDKTKEKMRLAQKELALEKEELTEEEQEEINEFESLF